MVRINEDVITLIIDWVDERGTLFSLLTVSKQVFQLTSKALYRDPTRFFRHGHLPEESTLQSKISLVQLLLSLSPAIDEDSNALRRAFDIPPKHGSETETSPKTMLDYLSLVQCVLWEQTLKHPASRCEDITVLETRARNTGFSTRDSFVRSTMTWCICGHRLGDIRELEVEVAASERFVDKSSQLKRLRSITAVAKYNHDSELSTYVYPRAIRLVKAIQQHHGKDLLQECRLASIPEIHSRNSNFHMDIELKKLLPPLLPRFLRLCPPLRPMDSYLSRLTTLTVFSANFQRWNVILKDYPDLSIGQVLQRCRALVCLSLEFGPLALDDTTAFAWAADECREWAEGRLSAPLVCLDRIYLRMECMPGDALRVLRDALHGFALSLTWLEVTLAPPRGGQGGEEVLLPSFTAKDKPKPMPRLESFIFSSTVAEMLDYQLLQCSPNLTSLVLSLRDYMDSDTPPTGWPELHLPCLMWLSLRGRAINLFNPASLHAMPKLEILKLLGISKDPSSDQPSLLDRWTWDWDLPVLTTLAVEMETSTANFSLKVLRGCPKLEQLSLEFPIHTEQPPYPLDMQSIFSGMTEAVCPELLNIQLQGVFSLQPSDIQALVGHLFPSLVTLYLETLRPCSLQQVFEFTRHHATLRLVQIKHAQLTETECQELGLVDVSHGDELPTGYQYELCLYTLEDESGANAYYRHGKLSE